MIRRAMRRVATVGLAVFSVTLLATCDLAKLTGSDTTSPASKLDPTDLTLTGGSSVVLGASITMGISSSVDLSGAFKRWTSSAPAIVSIDSATGVATGLSIGTAIITGSVAAPELASPVSKTQSVTVRYLGVRITSPTDSMTGLGQARTITVQGTNNTGVVQAGALSTGLTLTSSDPTVFTVSGSTIVAQKNGSARVVAVYQTLRDSVLIKVRQVAKRISFTSPDSLNYIAGALNTDLTVPLTVRDVADAIITAPAVTWRVADTSVATIGATGILRAKKVDTSRVYAKVDTVERSQKLLVVLPPAAPTGLTATVVSNTRIDLAWTDNSTNETGFQVDRCSGASCTSFALVTTTAANVVSFQNTGLTAATSYSFRVRAVNLGGNSAYTTTVSGVTLPNPPAAPTNLTATAVSATQINLAWTDASTDETGFEIDRCSGVSCTTFALITTTAANVVSFQSTGLTALTSYSFRIRAVNTGGSSAYTATATATTLTTPPTAPSGLVATVVSSTRIDLSWTDNSPNETGFEIERCSGVSCASFALVTTTAANAVSFQNTGLSASTSYSYRVRAVNAGGNSSFTATATATTLPSPPTAPSNLTATAISTTRIDLAWTDASTNETGFEIERCLTSACSSFALIATTAANVTAFQNTLLTAATSYTYRIRAVNTGGPSAYTASATASTLPNAPDLVVAAFSAPTAMPIGGSATVSLTVKNQGGVAAGPFKAGIYFSTNNIISTGDTEAAFCDFPSGLAIGATSSCGGSVTVPSLTTGTYFVGALADHQSQVVEFDENNNASTTITAALSPADVVTDGGFEFSGLNWNAFNQALVLNLSGQPYAGTRYLSLLSNASGTGLDNSVGTMYQDVTIPAGAASATLTFRYNITTSETTTSTAFDVLTVTVKNTANTTLSTISSLSNLNKASGTGPANYVLRTFDMSSFKGQTVRIHFTASSDSILPTVFRIDAVSLTWSP